MAVQRERLTPERRRELTRNALIDAATDLFAVKGFHATSLDEIADSAGFTRGAIYSNFPGGKPDLLAASVERYNDMLLHTYEKSLGVDPAKRAAAGWSTMLADNPAIILLSTELKLQALRDPAFRVRFVELQKDFRERITMIIRESATSMGAQLNIDAEMLGDVMWSASQGIASDAALEPERSDHWQLVISTMYRMLIEPPVTLARGPASGKASGARNKK
ncbi:MAG: TetR/AcrR family transcriptional regulator [Actinomycetota bacterium]